MNLEKLKKEFDKDFKSLSKEQLLNELNKAGFLLNKLLNKKNKKL